MTKLILGVFVFGLSIGGAYAQSKATVLTGVWRMTEVKRSGQNARTIGNPPGLLIFTGKYYSRMFVNSDQPRPGLQSLEKATAAELLAAWGPFTAASGTYEISGNTLTCHPLVAKTPGVMAPGTTDVYTFRVEGNKLTVVDVKNTRGPSTNPATITYTRIE